MHGGIILKQMKKLIDNIYYKHITYDNIRSMWEIVRKTCKNKKAIYKYTVHQNTTNYILYQKLLNCNYEPMPYRLFLIFEPKERFKQYLIKLSIILWQIIISYHI